jgi:WD40 repeat protein
LQLERPPHQISWSPDGDILAIGLDGGILVLWDMEQNTEIYRQDLNYSPDQYIHSLTWFPDSKTLIVSGTSVTIFEITGP